MSKSLITTLLLVAALAPEGEAFTAEVVNEGLWLTEAHLSALEAELSGNAATIAALGNDVASQTLLAQQSGTQLDAANATISAQATEIATLQAEVARLKKEPAADFSATAKPADAAAEKPSFSQSDDNPFNRFADSVMGKPKEKV